VRIGCRSLPHPAQRLSRDSAACLEGGFHEGLEHTPPRAAGPLVGNVTAITCHVQLYVCVDFQELLPQAKFAEFDFF
jgi:hypothetical protein